MTRNQQGFIYAICFVLFGLVMGGIHWLLTGINGDFGMGVGVGFFVGIGLLFLASRNVRETP
ncbi:hypothetical protein [Phyllobacterium leguminum]|uniref:Uncharacterized protein n=1 Tax=Phyllobacterium leguminum TaxID=314237 RepID=A0A318TIC7_9HYPH|nr:hypothetical protein [Phyllobacterium leguminum]PYE88766.1 hypothetical protein C7477_106139 [Phyllobacterium leguminum]